MNAFIAIMLESYRELNSKKLFWITLLLSGLVVLIFLGIGLDEDGLSLLGMGLPDFGVNSQTVDPEVFFKRLFINFGLAVWLAWIASVLALATTAEIFPSLMSNGAIDMVLSKPIRRLSLFSMKFLGGLLFMGLQVAVFCAASFVVIGLKTGAWEPGLFLAVPVMVLFFSYLFAVCVFFGVLTRSTIASLLLTLLVWFVIWIANATDATLLSVQAMTDQRVASLDRRIERQSELVALREARAAEDPADERRTEQLDAARSLLEDLTAQQASAAESQRQMDFWNDVIFKVKTALPKTGETVGLLERWLVDAADLVPRPDDDEEEASADAEASMALDDPDAPSPPGFGGFQPDQEQMQRDVQDAIRDRSVAWIIGTSLIFEFALLGFAAWRFQRRDF